MSQCLSGGYWKKQQAHVMLTSTFLNTPFITWQKSSVTLTTGFWCSIEIIADVAVSAWVCFHYKPIKGAADKITVTVQWGSVCVFVCLCASVNSAHVITAVRGNWNGNCFQINMVIVRRLSPLNMKLPWRSSKNTVNIIEPMYFSDYLILKE